jgi:hypothetical protein
MQPATAASLIRGAAAHAACCAFTGLQLPSFPQHQVSVKYATEHRCGVVVRGPGLTDAISGTDPLKDNLPLLPARPLDDSPEVPASISNLPHSYLSSKAAPQLVCQQ